MRRPDRAHHRLTQLFDAGTPVAGGIDFDVPGDGVRLRATRWRGSGTPVLLLHGLASQRRFWNLVVPHLAGMPLLAIDQRGHGESEQPPSGFDTATVTRDALTVLDAVGWHRLVVVGHSWGALTALSLAATAPDRVAAVVCIDGGFGGFAAAKTRPELRAMLTPPRVALPPDELRSLLSSSMPWASAGAADAVLPGFVVGADGLARARLPFEQHMQVVDAILDVEPGTAFDQVRCPTWLVSAEPVESDGDWATAKAAGLALAAERLAQPRLFRWGGAMHDVPLQWPALVAGLVRTAVDESEEGAPG